MQITPVKQPIDLVRLGSLMAVTSGRRGVVVGLIDGLVAEAHPDLMSGHIRNISGKLPSQCASDDSLACLHGTFVAGILVGRKGRAAPSICPECTLLVRPIFAEMVNKDWQIPSATPEELAVAIVECVEAGAQVLNLSVALARVTAAGQADLKEALDYAARQDVIVVAAAGNQGTLGSSAITRHAGVIPVVACDLQGKPIRQSNLGISIGRRGLRAPGEHVISVGSTGSPLTMGGTSVAAPFVTGTISLLKSVFPAATPTEIRVAVTQAGRIRRTSVVPPLLDAWNAFRSMITMAADRQQRA